MFKSIVKVEIAKTLKETVLNFLKANSNIVFRAQTIAKFTYATPNQVSQACHYLAGWQKISSFSYEGGNHRKVYGVIIKLK